MLIYKTSLSSYFYEEFTAVKDSFNRLNKHIRSVLKRKVYNSGTKFAFLFFLIFYLFIVQADSLNSPWTMASNAHHIPQRIRFSLASLYNCKASHASAKTSITTFPVRLLPTARSVSAASMSYSTCSSTFTWDDVVRVSQPEYSPDDSSDLHGYFEKIKNCNRGSVIPYQRSCLASYLLFFVYLFIFIFIFSIEILAGTAIRVSSFYYWRTSCWLHT